MFNIYNAICITNRHLLFEAHNADDWSASKKEELYLSYIEKLCSNNIAGIILREKDMLVEEYEALAIKVIEICNRYGTELYLHNFIEVAVKLCYPKIHLPMPKFVEFVELINDYQSFGKPFDKTNITEKSSSTFQIGVSCHSEEDLKYCIENGATYATLSHIFSTKCKEGLEPKGISFLKDTITNTHANSDDKLLIYALGGIHADNAELCLSAGADNVCMMSEFIN